MMRAAVPLLPFLLGVISACAPQPSLADAGSDATAGSDTGVDTPRPPRLECNPIGFDEACALPFPSTHALRDDSTSATGVRVALRAGTLPASRGGYSGRGPEPLDTTAWNRLDGFSPATPLLAWFPERVDPASLISPRSVEASLRAGSATVIVDAMTGVRVAHFSEVDATAVGAMRQALIIRPTRRLDSSRRYIVAITRSARTMDGAALTVPPGFRLLLDGEAARDPRLAVLAARFPAVLASLERAGVTRGDLVLAWEFATASETYLTEPVLRMRDQSLARIDAKGSMLTVTSIDEDFNVNILRRIHGIARVPLFLTLGGGNGAVLDRDTNGEPHSAGLYDVPFVAMIPRFDGSPRPLPLLQIGHGMFGSISRELGNATDTENSLQLFLRRNGYVAFGTNWMGLSEADLNTALVALSNLNDVTKLTDRLQQGIVNAVTLHRIARRRFASETAFEIDGASVVDATQSYYYGASLGGIMGASFMGYSPDCERGVLHVPGGAWSLLMPRNDAFGAFEIALRDYPDRLDRQLVLALAQSSFDPSDPINVAPHLLAQPLMGTPPKRILCQEAVGDSAVSNLATEMLARTMDLPLLAPSIREPHGLAARTAPLDSALAIWDESPTPLPPDTNEPPPRNSTHLTLRGRASVQRQAAAFLSAGGVVVQTCDEACDPD